MTPSLAVVTFAAAQLAESDDDAAAHPPPGTCTEPYSGIRAVCLDVDDTLIDYTGCARAALRAMLGTRGDIDTAWTIWQQITDEHALAVADGRLRYADMHALRTKAFFSAVGEELDLAEATRRECRRSDVLHRGWRLFPDARDCIEWLRACGMRVAAVTNASGSHQRRKLAELGLADVFDVVVIAGEVGAAKPDPVIFHTACSMLGCEPERTVHVGDKLHADAMGAIRAGLHGVWLDRDGHREYTSPVGVAVIDNLAQLPELLVCGPATGAVAAAVPGRTRVG